MRSLLILLRWPIRGWLHRRCLRRIALLERELFPAWQHDFVDAVDGYPEGMALRPGAIWRVESHNDVQIFRSPKTEWLENQAVLYKSLMARNLFYSGARASDGQVL